MYLRIREAFSPINLSVIGKLQSERTAGILPPIHTVADL